jgi:hypothetical protein
MSEYLLEASCTGLLEQAAHMLAILCSPKRHLVLNRQLLTDALGFLLFEGREKTTPICNLSVRLTVRETSHG